MADSPHLNLVTESQDAAAATKAALEHAIAELSPADRLIVTRIYDHLGQLLELVENLSKAVVGLSKLDDISSDRITTLERAVELLSTETLTRLGRPVPTIEEDA